MSLIAGVGKPLGAGVLTTGARPAKGRVFPEGKWKLVVMALAVGALFAFLALIAASETPKAGNYSSAVSSNSQSQTEAAVSEPGAAPQMSEQEALDAYGKLPLSFIPNAGQTDKAVRYYAQGAGYSFFFTKEGAMLSVAEGKGRGGHALALDFLGSDPDATLTASDQLAGKVNYLIGDDPAKWRRGLSTHGELLYGGLWPGIDMTVRGEGGKLKYEFHLKPGESIDEVRLGYRGAEALKVGDGGELLVRTSLGTLKDAAPVSYQRIGGKRVPVKSRYVLKGDGGYGFAVGAYDPRYPLVIDPGLDYSTFLGGAGLDGGQGSQGIAVRDGKAYVTGFTSSTDYPTTPGAFDRIFNGGGDAFVTKLNASGSALAYSTFLGGAGSDASSDIAVDGMGRTYVTGQTSSLDYPTTRGAFDRTFNGGGDAFVTKLNASGSRLAYSTFLGGGTDFDSGRAIEVDRMGQAYMTGFTFSSDYPTTPGAFDTTFNGNSEDSDAFVTKLNAAGSGLAYSTYLGGTSVFGEMTGDDGWDIAVREGRAYVAGITNSANYPTTSGAFDRTFNGGVDDVDAFVTKLNATGSALAYSTFLGGASGARGFGIAVDREGRAYVTGNTSSTDYPTTSGAFDRTFNGSSDAFVTKLNASGSELAYSTFLGGTSSDGGLGIAVDREGKAYVTGFTSSTDYPTTRGAFDRTFNGEEDAFVTKLNASGSELAYSTFLGGTNFDLGLRIAVREGRLYVTGQTRSSDYPTTSGAFDTTFNGGGDAHFGGDAFVTKLQTG